MEAINMTIFSYFYSLLLPMVEFIFYGIKEGFHFR